MGMLALKKQYKFSSEILIHKYQRKHLFKISRPQLDFKSMALNLDCSYILTVSGCLETPIQGIYISILGVILITAVNIVIGQLLSNRELAEATKILGEKTRSGNATSKDFFELGAVLIRKKLYTQALRNLEECIKICEEEPFELAKVYNAIGYMLSLPPPPEASIFKINDPH